jgi:hypothetical protein
MIMQAKRGFQIRADKLTFSATMTQVVSLVPSSVQSTLTDRNWHHARKEEFDVLITNNTWDFVPRHAGSNIITSKWIFKCKFNSDSTLE